MEEAVPVGIAAQLSVLKGDSSVAEFARKCGLGDSLVRKYLAGAEPGRDNIEKIWRANRCNLVWLVTGQGKPFAKDASSAEEERALYEIEKQDFVAIPHYDVRASAGLGIENGRERVTKKNHFRTEWWLSHVGVPAEQCFSMDIIGDSMAPRLTEGHVPIIQLVEGNEMHGDGIYVFRLDGEVFIKYLERRPGKGLIARSHNENYTPWEIGDGTSFGEFKIIGRVIRKMIVELP